MTRVLVPRTAVDGDVVRVDGADARYLVAVCRLGPGDTFTAACGPDEAMQVKIEAASRSRVVGRIVRRWSIQQTGLEVTLLQTILKARAMAWLVQKATELGAARIVPVVTERSVPRPDAEQASKMTERWARIAKEAAEQCGSFRVPAIMCQVPFAQAVSDLCGGNSLRILLHEQQGTPSLRDQLRDTAGGRVAIAVGPEGGFSPGEVRLAGEAGFRLASLGQYVLRAETAALSALAIVRYVLESKFPA